MTISSTVFWALIGSVLGALVIMVAAIIWTYFRKRKVIAKYKNEQPAAKNTPTKIRENVGELLWELKSKTEKPLDDFQMEFAINTVFRNEFKTFKVEGFDTNYESESIAKLGQSKLDDKKPKFILLNGDFEEINDTFDKYYSNSNDFKMIMIANASRKSKEIRRLMSYLKTLKAKYDWSKYGKGVLVVVK